MLNGWRTRIRWPIDMIWFMCATSSDSKQQFNFFLSKVIVCFCIAKTSICLSIYHFSFFFLLMDKIEIGATHPMSCMQLLILSRSVNLILLLRFQTRHVSFYLCLSSSSLSSSSFLYFLFVPSEYGSLLMLDAVRRKGSVIWILIVKMERR